MATITGTSGDDILNGTPGNDTIYGLEGNDTINAGAGNDLIDDGAGADTVFGESGIDTIIASADGANDTYDGGTNVGGRDLVNYSSALAGIVVDLGLAADQARSVGETDLAGIGVDQLVNIESVIGSAFDDTLTGNSVNNSLIGQDGDDTLNGGDGNDSLTGGIGNDTLDGGGGFDSASFAGGAAVTVSLAIAGTQNTGQGNDTLIGIEALAGSSFDDVLTGDDFDNSISGGDGNDQLNGAAGDDTLLGGNGNDHLDGGAGDDFLVGGNGSDTYVVTLASGPDTIVEDGIDGIDTLLSDGNWGLPTGIENFTVIGDTPDVTAAFGNELNNVMTGNDVENQFSGSLGNDTLYGGGGNDRLDGEWDNDAVYGQAGDDLIFGSFGDDYLDGGDGVDTLSFNQWGLAVRLDLAITGPQDTQNYGLKTVTGFEIVEGSQSDDFLAGDDTANTIWGGTGGTDIILGRGGDDTLSASGGWIAGGDGNDTITGSAVVEFRSGDDHDDVFNFVGQIHIYGYTSVQSVEQIGDTVVLTLSDTDSITFHQTTVEFVQNALRFITETAGGTIAGTSQADLLHGDDGNNSIYGNGGADQLFGGDGNDFISGGDADDLLNGQGGNDTLDGGEGSDQFFGGDGADTVSYSASATGVHVSLAQFGQQDTGGAGWDSLLDYIENLEGSQYDDVLTGNDLDNVITGGNGNDTIDGGFGIDTASYASASSGVNVDLSLAGAQDTGGAGTDTLSGIENLVGSAQNDQLRGNGADNLLDGGAGDDRMSGGQGNDIIIGGVGKDKLSGGAGNDAFTFSDGDFGGATTSTADQITDFAAGDVIDLRNVDADALADGDQDFTFVGTSGFSHSAGELRYEKIGGDTFVQGDANGDGVADFMIRVAGVHKLDASTFQGLAGGSAALSAEQSKTSTGGATSVALAGAIAAAGLAASQSVDVAGIHGENQGDSGTSDASLVDVHELSFASAKTDALRHAAEPQTQPDKHETAALSDGINASEQASDGRNVFDAATQETRTEAVRGDETAAHDGAVAAAPLTASAIAIPAAELLAALGTPSSGDTEPHSQLVGKILAEALHGGDGPIDLGPLLAALPGGNGPALAELAQVVQADATGGLPIADFAMHGDLLAHLALHHPDAQQAA